MVRSVPNHFYIILKKTSNPDIEGAEKLHEL